MLYDPYMHKSSKLEAPKCGKRSLFDKTVLGFKYAVLDMVNTIDG